MKELEFAAHPAINKAWLAKEIWGDSSSKNRKKISLRLSGEHKWQPEEVEKLKEAMKVFLRPSKMD